MDKQTKRTIKSNTKSILLFLLIAFPILCVICFILYLLVSSLVENQAIMIMLLVVIGAALFFAYEAIMKRRQNKKAEKLSKDDPYSK